MSVKEVSTLPSTTQTKTNTKVIARGQGIIKPCPFCGNPKVELKAQSDGKDFDLGTGYNVICNFLEGGCGAKGGIRTNREEAITAWNSRKK